MRILLVGAVLFLCVLQSNAARALDTEITVLAVRALDANGQRVNQMVAHLEQVWPNPSGIGLVTVQRSLLVPLPQNTSIEAMLNNAANITQIADLRQEHNADIVLIFVGGQDEGMQQCGFAPQGNWTGNFPLFPGESRFQGSPLDLRGMDDYHRAIMRTTAQCMVDTNDETNNPTLAAHELGHLLGAGHTRYAATDGRYLEYDSHAAAVYEVYSDPFPFVLDYMSIMSEKSPPGPCATIDCSRYGFFSNFGDSNNLKALQTTALSVANYRTAPGTGCSAVNPPFGVQGILEAVCAPAPWTQHFIWWQHQCPSQVATFWVWKRQPLGATPVPAWPVATTATPAFVAGAHAQALVQACSSGGSCSSLSSTGYVAESLCSAW